MKKILLIALALMLVLSLCACNNKEGNPDDTDNNEIILNPTGTGNGTGTGDPSVDTGSNGTGGADDPNTPPTEEVFTDLEQTIFIIASTATIRSEAYVSDSTVVDYAVKDTEFKSTAHSENWYRIEFVTEVEVTAAEGETTTETQTLTCYVHKTAAYVKDPTTVVLEQPITLYIIANALNVRSYYNFDVADNKMCTLVLGDEVTAVAKGNGWYKIQLSDDEEGNPVFGYISSNEKYVSTTKPEQTTEAAE